MKTTAPLPAPDTRSTPGEHPRPEWIQLFVRCAGAILLAGALSRFLIAAGSAQVLGFPDPMLGIPLRYAVIIVGAFELTVASFCLFGKRLGFKLAWLALLSTCFIIFWICLIWRQCPLQTSCLGSLTDPLRFAHGVTGYIFEFIPFGLVLGSCVAMLSFWLSKESRTARKITERQLAEERDAAAGLLKMLCPGCGGHVKFPAQNIGQQIPCPHCQKAITLRQADENLKMSCVLCGGHIEFPPHAVGQKIPCPHCAKNITLLEPVQSGDGARMPAGDVTPIVPPISPSPAPSTTAVLDSPRNSKDNRSVINKILLWGIVSILVIAISAGASLYLRRPQVITLADGTKLTLLGVTYGTHHIPPKIKIAGQSSRRNGAQLNSTNNTLVVWIEAQHKPDDYQWQSYQLLVYDPANTACVSSWTRTLSQIKSGVDVQGFMLDAYPRWDSKMILRAMSWGNNGQRVTKQQFVVTNSRRVSPPTWAAESLPDTQSDGDLDVTLTKLDGGAPGFNRGNVPSTDPMNKAVLAVFHTVQKGVVVNNWQPVRITTSDASGNQIDNNSWSNGRDQNGDATMTYQWGLWPAQSPWKVRVEMSRTSGFNSDEVWTLENVPVKPGRQMDLWNYGGNGQKDTPFAETTLNGVHLKLYSAIKFTDENFNGQQMGGFRVVADPPPDGYRLTLEKATDEHGREIQAFNPSSGGGNYGFQMQNMGNAKMLNLTIALHKSRFVEFTVKPSNQ